MPQFQPSADLSAESTFVQGYCVAMLWANTVGENFQSADPERTQDAQVTRKALREARRDARDFVRLLDTTDDPKTAEEWRLFKEEHSLEDAGHNFALSRNGHGSGFFDFGHGFPELQRRAKTYGEASWSLNRQGNATPL